MHQPMSTHDGVHGAGWQALGAADTSCFVDHSAPRRLFDTVGRIESVRGPRKQSSQCVDRRLTAGWALIDISLTFGDRAGVGQATLVATARALSLR